MSYIVAQWLISTLTCFCLSATVMLQWFLWFVYTGNVIHPYGVIVGIAIAAAQMLSIFRPRGGPESCPVPPRKGKDK